VGPFCQNALIAALPTTSQNNVLGTWSPAINNQQTTTYLFTPNQNECAVTVQMEIGINQPSESVSDVVVCFGEVPYIWNNLSISSSGQYQVTLVNQFGCDSVAILNFTERPLSSSLSTLTLCINDLPVNWNGQTYFNSGLYEVTLTNSEGCDSIAQLNLIVNNFIVPEFSADFTDGCAPLTVTFQNNTGGNFSACLWNFGNGQVASGCGLVTQVFTEPGCYSITLNITSANGCIGTTTITDMICVTATPIANFIANPNSLTTINPTVNFLNTSINATIYFWDFGDGTSNFQSQSPSHTYPEEQGFYEVGLIASNGICNDTVIQLITVNSEPLFYIPNTFTPDGDLFNQTFFPIFTAGFDIYDYNLLIFNRWGEAIFESNNADVGWDGTYGGQICQDGTYVWQIVFGELGKDKRQMIRGHVNLLR
jgi:gliding motility-associated-like protein